MVVVFVGRNSSPGAETTWAWLRLLPISNISIGIGISERHTPRRAGGRVYIQGSVPTNIIMAAIKEEW